MKPTLRTALYGASLLRLFDNGGGFLFAAFPAHTLFTTSAGSTSVAANDDPVGRAVDQSGEGNNATNSTDAQRPLWKANSGKPYLDFASASSMKLISAFAANTAVTLAAAFRPVGASASARNALAGGDVTGGKRAQLAVNASGVLCAGWGTVSASVAVDSTTSNRVDLDTVGILTADASTIELWLNGTRVYSGAASGTSDGTVALAIGAHQTAAATFSGHMDGRISAALALDRKVTAMEINVITRHFMRTF